MTLLLTLNCKTKSFNPGQIYVALSHVTSFQGPYILGDIEDEHIKANPRTDIPMLENNWYRNVMIPVIYQDHTNVKSLIVPTLGYIWHFIGSAKLWYTNVGELLAWEWNDSSEIPRTYQCKILKCTSLGIYLVFYWKCYEVMYQCWGIIGIGMKWFQ